MSNRRKAGDVIYKETGSGFVMQPCWGVIRHGQEPDYCMICDWEKEDCREWADVYLFRSREDAETYAKDPDGSKKLILDLACHVSECQMSYAD